MEEQPIRRCQAVITDKAMEFRSNYGSISRMCQRKAVFSVPIYDENSGKLRILFRRYYCKQHAEMQKEKGQMKRIT